MLNRNYSKREIAESLGRSPNTIALEIKRNTVRGVYDPKKAHRKSSFRRYRANRQARKLPMHRELRVFVERHLRNGQTPGAIAGRLKAKERHLPSVSVRTIYRYLEGPYGGALRRERKRRKWRGKGKRRKEMLANRRMIDKRPKQASNRLRVGDAEGDFIVSGRKGHGVILVVVDRKTRAVFIEGIPDVSIDAVHRAFLRIRKRFPEMKTITLDNDILFRMHETLAKLLSVKIYFCHPYHSWEKGSVENTNRYIRTFIPKGSDLSRYDAPFLRRIERKCNARFMRCLGYASPEEALNTHRARIKKRRARRR